jgi:hypothetical protein
MQIPSGAIIPFCILSFIVQAWQYYRINPDRRVFNAQFGMMFGAIVVMFADVFLSEWSVIYFVLAVVSASVSVYMIRLMPPSRH